jgi:hypothetical protein
LQNRLPFGLEDIGGAEATQKTATTVLGALQVHPTQSWQIGLSQGWTRAKQPLPDASNYKFNVDTTTVSLGFLSAGPVVPGIAAIQSRTRYSGIGDATRIREQTIFGTLSYRTAGFSTFTLSAGRTWRVTHLIEPSTDPEALASEGKTSAFTGNLGFQRKLTAKTSINLSAVRDFQQYAAGTNKTLGTGFGGGVNWTATPKLSVVIDALYSWVNIDDLLVAGLILQRKDLVRTHSVTVSYLATRRVSITGHLSRLMRNSTVGSAQFNNTTAGLDLAINFD